MISHVGPIYNTQLNSNASFVEAVASDVNKDLKADTHYPYIRPVRKNAAVYTGSKYSPYIRVLGTHYPYRIAVLSEPYTRAVYTGVKNTPVCTGRKYGPYIRVYIRAVFTGNAYRP